MNVTDVPLPDLGYLEGRRIPDTELDSTLGCPLWLTAHMALVIYVYPGSGGGAIRGDETAVVDAAQHRGFRDCLNDVTACGLTVVGLSSQSIQKQRRVARRLDLVHALASDPHFCFAEALGLPTRQLEGVRVYDRVILVVAKGITSLALHPSAALESDPIRLASSLQRESECANAKSRSCRVDVVWGCGTGSATLGGVSGGSRAPYFRAARGSTDPSLGGALLRVPLGLSILGCFSAERRRLTVEEIGELLDLPAREIRQGAAGMVRLGYLKASQLCGVSAKTLTLGN